MSNKNKGNMKSGFFGFLKFHIYPANLHELWLMIESIVRVLCNLKSHYRLLFVLSQYIRTGLCISKPVMTLFNLFDELNDICPFDFPAFARKYFWLTNNRLEGTWAKWHVQRSERRISWSGDQEGKSRFNVVFGSQGIFFLIHLFALRIY